MKKNINTPYVKKYNDHGQVTNPIQGSYLHNFENRKQRRSKSIGYRFMGNGKGLPITIVGQHKFRRFVQYETDKLGGSKRIFHYLPL